MAQPQTATFNKTREVKEFFWGGGGGDLITATFKTFVAKVASHSVTTRFWTSGQDPPGASQPFVLDSVQNMCVWCVSVCASE